MVFDVVFALTLTGGHYMNDFIFGAVAALAAFYTMKKYGYSINLLLLKGYTGVM